MSKPPLPEGWMATEATVTTCHFESGALSSMTFGVNLQAKFTITFDYYAHGRLYSGHFGSEKAIPQNEKIPLAYNPLHPEQNTYDPTAELPSTGPARSPVIAVGLAGSVILSLAWLLVLRGCHP